MINSVNLNNIYQNPTSAISQKNADNQARPEQNKKINFGNSDYESHPIRDLILTLTNDTIGLVGFNTALWWLQNTVNSKLLVGKINKHFTDKIDPEDHKKLRDLANQMRNREDKKLNTKLYIIPNSSEAYYTHIGDKVVVGDKQLSSLFHEFGHAVEENHTSFFKTLQRGRGNYTILALGLYALLSQKEKPKGYYDEDKNQGFFGKIKNFLSKSDAIIPLLAYSPELITEAKATREGLAFLEEKKFAKAITENTYKNIKHSYWTCFATYLFIPVSIMLLDSIQRAAEKKLHERKHSQTYLG